MTFSPRPGVEVRVWNVDRSEKMPERVTVRSGSRIDVHRFATPKEAGDFASTVQGVTPIAKL